MKLLFDQNISPRIVKLLTDQFPESSHVRYLGFEDASDTEIFMHARANDFTIVTFDSDFIDLSLVKGIPPKIIWLRTENLTTQSIYNLLLKKALIIISFLKNNKQGILEIEK